LHIISRKKLWEAGRKHRDAILPLDAWYRTANGATWRNPEEVRRTYAHAGGVPAGERTYTVFNIAGNKYRLIAEVYHEDQAILLRHVLTHAEYDKGDWKK
jgi:mRNA interferase HigB